MANVDVWIVPLDAEGNWLPPTPAETGNAARLVSGPLRRRYLRSHAALRAILGAYTSTPLDFAMAEHGKPYLLACPDLRFNLSHSHDMALVAVTRGIEIGVDVERFRPCLLYTSDAIVHRIHLRVFNQIKALAEH